MFIDQILHLKDLTEKIIPHFDNYPLLTQKATDFSLFKQIIIGSMLGDLTAPSIQLNTRLQYFNKYPLIGEKGKDFKQWEVVYHMIVSKEHNPSRIIFHNSLLKFILDFIK